jgi:hypothetical protein
VDVTDQVAMITRHSLFSVVKINLREEFIHEILVRALDTVHLGEQDMAEWLLRYNSPSIENYGFEGNNQTDYETGITNLIKVVAISLRNLLRFDKMVLSEGQETFLQKYKDNIIFINF